MIKEKKSLWTKSIKVGYSKPQIRNLKQKELDMIVICINSTFHWTLKIRYGMIKENSQQEHKLSK